MSGKLSRGDALRVWPLLGQSRFTLLAMRHVTELAYWEVTVVDGHTVEVWADGYQEIDDAYVFTVLADVSEEQQKDLLITGRAPTDTSG